MLIDYKWGNAEMFSFLFSKGPLDQSNVVEVYYMSLRFKCIDFGVDSLVWFPNRHIETTIM